MVIKWTNQHADGSHTTARWHTFARGVRDTFSGEVFVMFSSPLKSSDGHRHRRRRQQRQQAFTTAAHHALRILDAEKYTQKNLTNAYTRTHARTVNELVLREISWIEFNWISSAYNFSESTCTHTYRDTFTHARAYSETEKRSTKTVGKESRTMHMCV